MKTYTKQDIINAMKKLHPCPFCGTVPKIIITDDEGNPRNTDYLNDTWSGIAFGIRHDVVKECPISFGNEDDADCIPMGNRLYNTPDELVETWNSAIQNTKERTSEGKLTKERVEAFLEERRELNAEFCARGLEIIEKAKSAGIDIRVSSCDEIKLYEHIFSIISGRIESIGFPIDALYSDEILDKFIEFKKELKQRSERIQQLKGFLKDTKKIKKIKKR